MTLHRYRQINDVHISDQPPSGRTASYLDDVLAKLDWAVTVPSSTAAIIITGDLLHRKNAAHTTHRTVQRIRDVLTMGVPVYIVPGNHDEAHGGGLDGQPLLSVVDGGRIQLLDGRSLRDPLISGVPWNNAFEGEFGVSAFGDAVRKATQPRGRHDIPAPLVFAHAPISLDPFPFGPEERGWMLAYDVISAMPFHVHLLAHGHFHNGHPVEQWGRSLDDGNISVITRITLSNPGALARASLSTDDVTRRPMVADITYDDSTGTVEVEYVEVECARPADEVLRIERHEREAHRDGTVEALAASLAGADAEVVDADTMRAHLRGLVRPDTIAEDVWTKGIALADAALDGVTA